MVIRECHELEPQIGINGDDQCCFLVLLKQQQQMPEIFWPEKKLKSDLCDAGAVLYHMSYQA